MALRRAGAELTRRAVSAVALRCVPTEARSAAAATSSAPAGALVRGGSCARKKVAWWLAGTAGWSLSLIALGGVTRLTGSGLSMTSWRWVGERPPLTDSDWQAELDAYRASPEYRHHNRGISLPQFKFIYWMEYAHRAWGRAMAAYFLLPAGYFAYRGFLTSKLFGRLALLFGAGASQAFVGWWMVRSGLEEPSEDSTVGSRVSPYRLASHLAAGATIYSGLVWTALDVAFPNSAAQQPGAPANSIVSAAKARRMLIPLTTLICVTALSGAFVAGLDAGRAYNTIPLMNGQLIPDDYWPNLQPWWRNMVESTSTVQLHHRALAVSTLVATTASWIASTRMVHLPHATRLCMHGLLGMTSMQVTLGVSVLLTYVPISLGSLHQVGAFSLFTVALAALHTTRLPSSAAVRAASSAARKSASTSASHSGSIAAAAA